MHPHEGGRPDQVPDCQSTRRPSQHHCARVPAKPTLCITAVIAALRSTSASPSSWTSRAVSVVVVLERIRKS